MLALYGPHWAALQKVTLPSGKDTNSTLLSHHPFMFGYQAAISNRRLDRLKRGNALREYVIEKFVRKHSPQWRVNAIKNLLDDDLYALMDTRSMEAFFDRFYAEINDLCREWTRSTRMPVIIYDDVKSSVADFAFRQTLLEVVGELGCR